MTKRRTVPSNSQDATPAPSRCGRIADDVPDAIRRRVQDEFQLQCHGAGSEVL